jgi:uncharacterized protein (TIGR00725 family)
MHQTGREWRRLPAATFFGKMIEVLYNKDKKKASRSPGGRMPGLMTTIYVAVIGGGEADPEMTALAYEVGRELARKGAVVVCGGLGGVMEAAARGVQEAGGVSIGILPGPDRRFANPYLTYTIPTYLGHARNMLIAHSATAVIAIGGSYGTISEAAIALKLGKPVVALQNSWSLPNLKIARTPGEAVSMVFNAISAECH